MKAQSSNRRTFLKSSAVTAGLATVASADEERSEAQTASSNNKLRIGFIGTGMSESSGIFTFPQTGIYKITFSLEVKNNTTTDGVQAIIKATTNNSSYSNIVLREISIRSSGDTEEGYAITTFDCTDTSTHKLKFVAADFKSSSIINGSSTNSETYVIFERLGDT